METSKAFVHYCAKGYTIPDANEKMLRAMIFGSIEIGRMFPDLDRFFGQSWIGSESLKKWLRSVNQTS